MTAQYTGYERTLVTCVLKSPKESDTRNLCIEKSPKESETRNLCTEKSPKESDDKDAV